MLSVSLEAITKAHIDALVAEKVAEFRALEYKSELPGNGDEAKKEFLADVSSFANGAGGDLIYGVTAERDANGKPTGTLEAACGLSLTSTADAEVLRLENILRDGIEPRISGIGVRPIEGFVKGPVIVVRVPRSFAAPHMVTFRGTSRFFGRNSAGKFQLDVGEVRAAFAASEAVPQAIRRFREERLARISAGDTPVPLEDSPKLVMHLYPLTAARPGANIEIDGSPELQGLLWPMNRPGYNTRHNFDGYLAFGGVAPIRGYVQLFRDGCVESVTCRTAYPPNPPQHPSGQIPSPAFENTLADGLGLYRRALAHVGVAPPVVLMVSLLGVRGFRVVTDTWWFAADIFPIERDVVPFPDILLEELDGDPRTVLRPISDMLWQASGISRSPHYDESGNWVERRR